MSALIAATDGTERETGLSLQSALDLEPYHAAAGEQELHYAGRRIGRHELDGQQVEHGVLVGGRDVARLEGVDALEPKRRAPAPVRAWAWPWSRRWPTVTKAG